MNANRTLTAKNLGHRQGAKVRGIVLHDTAGSGTSGDAKYLANDPEQRGVSVDFCIVKDGTIYQLNPDMVKYYTFHAGRKTRWVAKQLQGQSVNKGTVGIEIAQKAKIESVLDPKYPVAQVSAVAQVCVHLCEKFQLTKLDITTHKDLITDGSRTDPRQWPWAEFWSYFNQYSGHEPEGGPSLGAIHHTVVAGDTLWGLANKYNTKIEVIKALNNMNTMSNVITVGQTLLVKE